MASPPATVIQIAPHADGQSMASNMPAAQTPKVVQPTTGTTLAARSSTVTDKVLSSAANLAQLLPTGTVLAYQALSPSFTNHGQCYTSNRYLAAVLVAACTASCIFFAFTDSLVGRDRKLYYGVATPWGFHVLNFSGEEEHREWTLGDLRQLRARPLDIVHAAFAAAAFAAVALGDAALQRCYFPDAGASTKELLTNLPLGMGFLSSMVFMIFPTSRKGIGYTDSTPHGTQ